jgi:hypothetical protein
MEENGFVLDLFSPSFVIIESERAHRCLLNMPYLILCPSLDQRTEPAEVRV